MTLHRAPLLAAATAKCTGALWRVTPVPEFNLPVSVPSAVTPLAVARKLVIFADSESLDDAPPILGGVGFAFAGGAMTAARVSAEKAAATSLRIVPSPLMGEIDPPPARRYYPLRCP